MKKYKVSFELSIFMIGLFLLSTGILILTFFLGLIKEDFVIVFTISFMLFIFPLVLLIIMIYMMWPTIIIYDKGIEKRLFGKLKRHILWEEVKSVKLLGNNKQWLFMSKSELNTKSLTIARMKKDNIYIYIKKDLIEDVRKYIPEKVNNL